MPRMSLIGAHIHPTNQNSMIQKQNDLCYCVGSGETDEKLVGCLRAWGSVMKRKSQHFRGMTLSVGLAMYLQGCKESVFKTTGPKGAGISCSYSTVVAHLKKTKSRFEVIY